MMRVKLVEVQRDLLRDSERHSADIFAAYGSGRPRGDGLTRASMIPLADALELWAGKALLFKDCRHAVLDILGFSAYSLSKTGCLSNGHNDEQTLSNK